MGLGFHILRHATVDSSSSTLTLAALHAGYSCTTEPVSRDSADITPGDDLAPYSDVPSEADCYQFCDQLSNCYSAVYVLGFCYLKSTYPDAGTVVAASSSSIVLLWCPIPP